MKGNNKERKNIFLFCFAFFVILLLFFQYFSFHDKEQNCSKMEISLLNKVRSEFTLTELWEVITQMVRPSSETFALLL